MHIGCLASLQQGASPMGQDTGRPSRLVDVSTTLTSRRMRGRSLSLWNAALLVLSVTISVPPEP